MSGAWARLASRARGGVRGFTLIELTVSLVAGLVVAMAVAVLSHEATASFNEEVRVSAAEATLRGAADRLRSDLQRASYMSTPNIEMDPNLAKLFAQVGNLPPGSTAAQRGLQGILFTPGSTGTNSAHGLTLESTNNITPASIDVTGNLTGADQFEVQSILPGACCTINLAASSPSIFRILNATAAGVPDPNADAEMQNTFAPAPAATGNAFTQAPFWVRYVDMATNHAQYLLTCSAGGKQVAGITAGGGGTLQPYVLTTQCPLTGAQTGTITATNGNTAGVATVNPIVTARWEVASQTGAGTNPPPQDIAALANTALEAGVDTNKYDLVRSLVDGNGNLLKETTEVVAEYAVGLDFSFGVDTEAFLTGQAPKIVVYDFGDTNNASVAGSVVPLFSTTVNGPNTPDPQRIRSVRFMMETRAAIADRTATIPVQSVADGGGGTFLYRYCMTPTGCSGNSLVQWARVRTIVGEVSLPNQQQAFY